MNRKIEIIKKYSLKNKFCHLAIFLPLIALLFIPSVFAQTADVTGPTAFGDCDSQQMTVTINNNGTQSATDVLVEYIHIAGFSYVSGSTTITYSTGPVYNTDPTEDAMNNRFFWNLPVEIPAGEDVVITFNIQTNCSATSGVHRVFVYYGPIPQVSTSDSMFISVNHGAITVNKTPSVNPAEMHVGDTITWTITIRSTGYGPARNLEITDTLGAGLTLISSDIGPGNSLTGTYAQLDAGDSLIYTVQAQVSSCSDLEDTISVSWGCGGGTYCQTAIESSASIDLTIRDPQLHIDTLSPNPINFSFCSEQTVTVLISNIGAGTAYNSYLAANIPAGYNVGTTSLISATPPATVIWNAAQSRWDFGNIPASGQVEYTFTLTRDNYCTANDSVLLFDANAENECAEVFTAPMVEIRASDVSSDFPSLSASKTAPVEATVGDSIPFTLTVSYNGNPAYSGDVTIVDYVPSPLVPQNINPAGTWDPVAGTITWVIPQALVVNGVILDASYDCPMDDPDICLYCFHTFSNSADASTILTCPLAPGGTCPINATASAATRINCEEIDIGDNTVTGSKDMTAPPPPEGYENCTSLSFTFTFVFGTGVTGTWSDIALQEMLNNNQIPAGSDAIFTVSGPPPVTVTQSVPINGRWDSLSFLDGVAPGPAGQTLTVEFEAYQNDTGTFYNDAVLTVPGLGGNLCSTGNEEILVTEQVSVAASSGSIGITMPAIQSQCETLDVVLTVSKGTFPLYNPAVTFSSDDYQYIPNSAQWNGDGTNFPAGFIEPEITGNTLRWDNDEFGFAMKGAGVDQYYSFENGGTITLQVIKVSSCSNFPTSNAELYFDDNCERLGRNGAPSPALKSTDSAQPVIFTKGNVIIRKFPELVTSRDDLAYFTVTVVNSGDGPTYNTVFRDILGPDLIYDPVYPGPATPAPDTVDPTNRILTFFIGDLAPNEERTFTIPVRLVGCDEPELINTAEAEWGCGGILTDCQPLPVSRQARVRIPPSLLLIRGSGDINLCETNNLRLEVLNAGDTVLYSAQAIFILPTGVIYLPGNAYVNGTAQEPTISGNELIWDVGTMNVGDPSTIITFDVTADCSLPEPVIFQAYGIYIEPCKRDAGITTNSETYELDIHDHRPDIVVVKTPPTSTADRNQPVTWTITMTNSGDSIAHELEFYDVLPPNVSIPGGPGWGIINELLDGGAPPGGTVFDDGGDPHNLGDLITPRTLIDLSPGSTISFQIVTQVNANGCTPLPEQNTANVTWGCGAPFGCEVPYVTDVAQLITSPLIEILNHTGSEISICGAEISFQIRNNGSTAYNIDLTDTLPNGYVYIPGTATMTTNSGTAHTSPLDPEPAGTNVLTWDSSNISEIWPNETLTITLRVQNNISAPPPPPLPPDCFVPIDDDNTVGITYENSCFDSFGPVTDTLHITANTPVFTVDIIPATQIILGGSVVNWTIQVNNGVGGNIIGSLDVVFQFGAGFDWTTINPSNGSDGTVPVVDNVNGRVFYYDVSIPENSAWTAPISAQALPNPPIVDLVVDVTATGICGSGCFYGEVTFTSSAAHGDMSKIADITEAPIGEIVTYTITVDYNHSSTLYQNAYIEDTLPAGLTLVSQTYTGPNQPIIAVETAPNVWQWNVGDFTSAAGGSQSVITIGARVDNILANQDGLLFTDRADVRYLVGVFDFQDYRTLDAPTVIEPDLQVAKALARVTPAPPPADQGDAGDVIEYTLTVSHTGTSTADAYNVTIEDPIPADMTYVVGSQSSSPLADNFQIAGNTLQWTYNTFTQGTTATITYRLSVDTTAEPEQVITNTGTLKWTSLPSGHTNDGTVHERDGDDGPGLLNDYVDTASSSFTITSPSFTKVLNAAPPLPEYTITSAIPYRITVNVIEGTIPDLIVRENIPDYMTIANISITSAWLYSTTGPVYAPGASYIEWDFGTISNPAPSSGNIIIDFDLIVSDDANNDDLDTFTNSSRMTYQNASGSTITLTSTAVPVQINVPALVTTKTVTSVNGGPATATVAPGDVITYRYRVTNVGSGTASNVNITDTFPDNYLSYVSGNATVNGVPLGSDPTGLPGPNLDFNLNLTIAGYGQADLIFQATVLPDVTDVTAGAIITNTAHAAGNDSEGNPIPADNRDHVAADNDLDDTDSVNRTVVVPGLIVNKDIILINGVAPVVGQKIEPGDDIRYRITVRNVGGVTVYNLTVTDWLPTPGFTYQAGSTNATWQYPAPLSPAYTGEPVISVNQLQWIIPGTQLDGGNPMGNWLQLEFTCDISSDITEGDTYTNETYVIAYDGHNVQVPAASSDPEDTNPTDHATVSIIGAEPIITSTKTVYRINGAVPTGIPPIAGLNDIVTFQYEVQNTGSGTAYNIILQDTLPNGFSYINNTTSITWPGGSLTNTNPTAIGPPLEWNMNTLQPAPAPTLVGGGTLTLRFDAQVTNNAYIPLPAGNWVNNASVRVEDGAGTELTHSDDAELAPAEPALVVNKEVVSINGVPGALDAEPGDYVLYRITVTNVGRGLASNFNVEDSVPAGLDYNTTIAPPCSTNASWDGDFTGTFTNDPTVAGNPTTGETLTWNTTNILGGDGVILGFNNVLTVEYTIYVTSSITEGQTLTNQCYSNALDGRDVQIPADNSAAVPADTDNDDRDDASITVHEPAFVTDKTIVAVNGVPPTSTPPVVGYNDTVTFEYSVQNVGGGTAHNIILSDTLPAGFSYVTNSSNISWPGGTLNNVNPTVMGPPLAWSMDTLQPAPLPTLAGGEMLTLRFTARVTDLAFRPLPAGNWINTSWVRGNDGAGTAIPLNNSADVPADIDLDDEDSVDMIPAEPALVVNKEVVSVNGVAGITAVQPGDYIRYRATVTNVGQGLAFRMILDDTLDIGLDYDAATCATSASWNGGFPGSFTNDPAVTGDPITGENIRWNTVSILGGDGIILTPGAVITIEYDIYVTTFIVQGQPIDNVMHAAGVDGRTTSIPEDNSSNVPADTDLDDRDNTMLFTHEPALIVTKTVDKEVVQPGDTVTFTITVENVGMGDALNLVLTDTLPDCFSYVADTAQAVWPSDPADPSISPWIGDPLIDRHQLTFNIGATLNGGDPRGEMLTFTFQAYVGSGCNPQVTNYVMATGVDGDNNPIILYGIDADDTDNDDADDVPIRVLLPALEIEKSIVLINNGPPTTTIKPGDIITYEIKISNTGFAPLTSLTVNDRIPATAFLYRSGSSQYNGSAIADPVINGNQLTYSIDQTLDAGKTSTLRFSLEVTEALEHGMEYTNCADVVGIDGAGGEIYSNESCTPANGFIPPNLMLVKTVASVNGQPSTGKVRLGDTVTYQIVLTNPGPADIVNFTINDRTPTTAFEYKNGSSSLNGISIPDPTISDNELKYLINQQLKAGESATLEFSLTVTSAVRNGAIYTNCADATGMDETGTENKSNESCVDIEGYVPGEEIIDNIKCKVSTSGLSNQLCAGGIAVYCMEVTNDTNLTIPGLIAQAQLPVGITFLNGTTVIDGVASPDPARSGDTLSWTLPDLPATGSIHLCFQLSITANAQRGRQDFNFLIKDIEGNIINCEVENIITVNDCGEGFCGYLEKIHMPYHECLRLTSLVDPKFNTSIAMYAAGNFYNFARSERISPVGGTIYLEPDYDRLWRFRLFDIAEKNLDSLSMKPGIGIKLNDGIGYLEYSSAIPFFTKEEDKPINFWSSTIDKYIDLDSLGFTIFAQSERILTLSQNTGFLPGNTASIENEFRILEQLRSKVKLLGEWLDNKNLIREKPADHFPKTVEPEIKDNILTFRVTDDTSDLYSQSALLLGLSRYITAEKATGNEGDSNQENIATAFKSIDSLISEIRKLIDQFVETGDKEPKEVSSIDLKGFNLAARALAELKKIDDRYSTEITDLQKIIWNLVTGDESRKWTSLYDRLAIAELSLSMYQTGGDNAYLERSLNTIESIDTDLWNEKLGLYHTNSPQGEYLYTPVEISQYINLYQYLVPHMEKEKTDRLRTHLNRFLSTVLLKGGMQLDDRWRRNQYLEISSGSEHQSTRAIFTTPLNQRLIPVLNEKIEFIDPATSSIPLSLSQYDASDIIKIENLVCDLSLAEPSRRLFITDIGSFALVELFATAQMINSFTYPTYLLDYNPNEAWLLGQKMAEYAIYNSFALDYASRSGIDLRYSESEKMTEDQAIKLLSESVAGGAPFISPQVFKPLFVKFGTSLPGADKSIAEMIVYNPHLLGYREDRNIYSSAIGLNLARMVNEYRYLSSTGSRTEGYIIPVIKQQMGSLVQFIKNHLSDDNGYNFNLPDHFYPYINSSGEPVAITGSEASADLFSYLAFIDGLLAYRNLNTDNPDSQLDEMIAGLTRFMIGKFLDKEKGRFINSGSDKDISTINLYYLNHIIPEIEKVAGGSDIGLSVYLNGNLDLLRKEIIGKEGKVKISLEGKPDKVSSIVDINTEPAAHCAALRMLLDEYRRTNKNEFLTEAKALYDSLKTKGYDELLRVFKGTEIVDERIQNEVRYHYNSFDIGMIIATLRDIIPYLEYKEKSAAIELLSVFFDKVVEGAEVQYLPYNEAGRTRLGQKFLPGIRTEVTVRYDKDTTLIKGAYPGDTVKFVVFIENRCGNLLAGSTSPDNLFDHLEVLDLLPPEFKYIPGSTYVNGVQGPDPSGERELVWQLKGISYDGVIVLSFLTDVTLNAVEGKYINYAKMGYFPAQEGTLMYSPTGFAQTTVTVLKPGKLYIRFFEDTNANGIWDENEKERFIPTYRVMLDNNLPITSDKDGRFAPYLIKPGQHTLTLSTFKIEDYWWATSTNPIIFSALVERDTGINIPLVYKKVVEGYVYVDNNSNSKYDPGEGLKNVELITTTGQMIISGEDGYFYYFAQYPTETIKHAAEQRFNKTENAAIYIKE